MAAAQVLLPLLLLATGARGAQLAGQDAVNLASSAAVTAAGSAATGPRPERALQQAGRQFSRGITVPQGRRLKNAAFRYRSSECPDSWDWRSQNVITPVQDQGSCGSCWAFAAAGAMSAAHAIDTATPPVALSESSLVDCFTLNCAGCQGGWTPSAWLYTISQQGIPSAAQVPYVPVQGRCQGSLPGQPPLPVRGFDDVPINETALLQAACNTPVAVAVDASNDWSSYSGGVFSGTCSSVPEDANHAVLLVGYGTDASSGQRYWVIQNSWGTGWGEAGYIRLPMGVNKCGVANWAAYTYFSDVSPNTVTVQCAASVTVSTANATITSLATQLGVDAQDLLTANPAVLSQDQVLPPSTVLNVPPCNITTTNTGPCSIQYVVQANDTLSSLATQFNVPRGSILRANPGLLSAVVNASVPSGSQLVIPGQPCPSPAPVPSPPPQAALPGARFSAGLLAGLLLAAWLLLA